MEFGATLSPLVTVSGVPNFRSKQEGSSSPEEHDRVVICQTDVPETPLVNSFSRKLSELSQSTTPWDPKLSKLDRLNLYFTNEVFFPSKRVKPSAISPKHPSCKAPVFTHRWIQKYTKWSPSVSIMLRGLPSSEDEEDKLISSIQSLNKAIAQHGTFLVCILVGKVDELAQITPYIRKQTGFSRSELLALPDDLNDTETEAFAGSVFNSALVLSKKFFANKLRSLREKRNALEPPLDLLVWDTRFTLKLAYCSEFRGDMAGAIKLFESAYDSLALLLENRAISVQNSAYGNARQILDVVAMKIFQHSLPSRLAFDKLNVHIAAGEKIWIANKIGPRSPNAVRWRAMQHAQFAQFCTIVKQLGIASAALNQQPSGMPTGLIWLDAAKAFAAAPHIEESEIDDPYAPFFAGNPDFADFTPQHVFLNAISELSGSKRAKAYALVEYGKWLKNEDFDAASQAFQSARQSLSESIWPEVRRFIGTHLKDNYSLFMLGDLNDFTEDVEKEACHGSPLFSCTGTFESSETHVGREIRAQVTLIPRFSGNLTMKYLTINHSLGSVTFEQNDEKDERIYLAQANSGIGSVSPTNLSFKNGESRTFQFSITSVDIGEVELSNVEWKAGNHFSQSLVLEAASDSWLLNSGKPSPRSRKHLLKAECSLKVTVKTRPAKLEIVDCTPAIVAVGERLKYKFELHSREDEDIIPKVEVTLLTNGQDVSPEELHRHTEETCITSNGSYIIISDECDIPTSPCELIVTARFDTSADTLPVHFEFRKTLDVVRPFRVTFNVVPVYLLQQWPAVFAPSLSIEQIPRKWRLESSILSLFNDSDIILHSCNIMMESDIASLEIEETDVHVAEVMHYNNIKRLSHTFLSRINTNSSASTKTFEAIAYVSLIWSRKTNPDLRNIFKLPQLRLNLPAQEPRALVVADVKGAGPETSQVTYHIENATSKLLSFSISVASSTYFAFQGPKSMNLRLLPFSTRALTYQLTPLGDGSVQNKRPLPDLRIFDINYKRTLAVLPGDQRVTFEQGTLFL